MPEDAVRLRGVTLPNLPWEDVLDLINTAIADIPVQLRPPVTATWVFNCTLDPATNTVTAFIMWDFPITPVSFG